MSNLLGHPGAARLVGDWDGDGRDTLALRRGGVVLEQQAPHQLADRAGHDGGAERHEHPAGRAPGWARRPGGRRLRPRRAPPSGRRARRLRRRTCHCRYGATGSARQSVLRRPFLTQQPHQRCCPLPTGSRTVLCRTAPSPYPAAGCHGWQPLTEPIQSPARPIRSIGTRLEQEFDINLITNACSCDATHFREGVCAPPHRLRSHEPTSTL